jgi:hypothetical protein
MTDTWQSFAKKLQIVVEPVLVSVLARGREMPGKHLIEDHTESIDIRSDGRLCTFPQFANKLYTIDLLLVVLAARDGHRGKGRTDRFRLSALAARCRFYYFLYSKISENLCT